jgi:hypothetical protein
MDEYFSELQSDQAKPQTVGLACGAPCKHSFELDLCERSLLEMAALLAAFGRDDDPEFVEDDADGPADSTAPIPETPFGRELRENEDATLAALSDLWARRLSIAHAVTTLDEYRSGCKSEGLTP